MSPYVSVVIPCYNQGNYIEEAVDSVLAQSYDDLEIIIVDDGSIDGETRRFLENYAPPKTRILYSENKGVSHARNLGIQEASGTYILPLDGDDKIAPTYIEKALQILESRPDLGIVYCEAAFFGGKTGPWKLPPYEFPNILVGNCIFCTALFRKSDWEKVGGYKEDMKTGWEDWEFWLSLIEAGAGVYRIPETLFCYRQAENSMSQLSQQDPLALMKTIMRYHPHLYIEQMEHIIGSLNETFSKWHVDDKTLFKVNTKLGAKYKLRLDLRKR
jgi:glycosyltransferase involved in cell wall biosynthesis